MKPEEAKVVVDILCGAAGCADKAQAEGVYINGERFVVFKIEGRSIYGRKVSYTPHMSQVQTLGTRPSPPTVSKQPYRPSLQGPFADHRPARAAPLQGKEGVCIVKTKQAILVSHYDENIQAGNSAATVEALADYLINAGY